MSATLELGTVATGGGTPVKTAATAMPTQTPPGSASQKKADASKSGSSTGKKKADKKGPKPYGEIITEEMISTPGLFTVHRDGDEVYFEIPAAELGQDMLWVTQIAETQAGFSWAGMPVVDRVVRWERHGDRILLRDVRYDIRADVDDPIQGAVEATSVAPIIRIFEIKTYGEGEAPVIEVSSFFTSDVREFSAKEALDAEGLDGQRTLMGEVKAFPENIIFEYEAPRYDGRLVRLTYSFSELEGTKGYEPRAADRTGRTSGVRPPRSTDSSERVNGLS